MVPVGSPASFTVVAEDNCSCWGTLWEFDVPSAAPSATGDCEGPMSHTYDNPGIYSVGVVATDSEGNTSDTAFVTVVVYDPTGGFVTGGGWIDSPVKPEFDYMSVGGKASFGFISKYKKGATAPTGQTEFMFKAGDLNFHSTSYQWLVVTGSNYAKFKGEGTINGAGLYKFQIWAGDGGKTDPDTFRIKIWTEDTLGVEDVAYENDIDQEISGGSIVIHTK